jgi:hypothetical protein
LLSQSMFRSLLVSYFLELAVQEDHFFEICEKKYLTNK